MAFISSSAEEKEKTAGEHSLTLENRRLMQVSGVTDIDSFDENGIMLYTQLGELLVKGKGLHVSELSVENGRLIVEGDIWSLSYGEKNRKAKAGLIKKALR